MDNDNKRKSESTVFLEGAFASEQECLISKLKSSFRITHKGDRGEVNEQFFIEFLRAYLPNRYTVEKAIILDSNGSVSHSIDIVVFDRQYTPTLFDNDKHRYVPAEAVYAVFECKPKIDKGTLEYTGDKIASVRRLQRTSVEVYHTEGVSKPKSLFQIIGGILALDVGWADGLSETFRQNHEQLTGDRQVDCGFAASGACFDIFSKDASYSFGPSQNALAYFAFRLLWKLQSMATVPAVDWMAYANQLSNTDE
jgi:hypothetical protein